MKNIFDHYANGEKLYTHIVSPLCERYELTYMEFTVLMFLANNPQYDTASEIVRYRHLTKSHVSISIRALLEKGLLIGEYRDRNRRSIHLSLTKAADRLVQDGRAAQKEFREVLFRGFSQAEMDQLSNLIDRVDTNIRSYETTEKTGETKE